MSKASITPKQWADLKRSARAISDSGRARPAKPRKSRALAVKEADIEATCSTWLALDGWTVEHTEATFDRERRRGTGRVGMADTLAMRPLFALPYTHCGKLVYPKLPPDLRPWDKSQAQVLKIEWKAKNGKLSEAQFRWHLEQSALGLVTLVAGRDFAKTIEGFKAWYRASGLMVNKLP